MINLEKTKSALLYAPAAALTLLAGYEGIADTVEARAADAVPAVVAYASDLVSAAVHAAAHDDVSRLESLFAPSVRKDGLEEDLRAMLDFMGGHVCEFAGTELYHGARASDEAGLRYEYVSACVSGVRAGNHEYAMRFSVFVDGEDAERNRGVATMSVADTAWRGRGRPCCVNVGRLPVC